MPREAAKAQVAAHTRTVGGKVVQVASYENKRQAAMETSDAAHSHSLKAYQQGDEAGHKAAVESHLKAAHAMVEVHHHGAHEGAEDAQRHANTAAAHFARAASHHAMAHGPQEHAQWASQQAGERTGEAQGMPNDGTAAGHLKKATAISRAFVAHAAARDAHHAAAFTAQMQGDENAARHHQQQGSYHHQQVEEQTKAMSQHHETQRKASETATNAGRLAGTQNTAASHEAAAQAHEEAARVNYDPDIRQVHEKHAKAHRERVASLQAKDATNAALTASEKASSPEEHEAARKAHASAGAAHQRAAKVTSGDVQNGHQEAAIAHAQQMKGHEAKPKEQGDAKEHDLDTPEGIEAAAYDANTESTAAARKANQAHQDAKARGENEGGFQHPAAAAHRASIQAFANNEENGRDHGTRARRHDAAAVAHRAAAGKATGQQATLHNEAADAHEHAAEMFRAAHSAREPQGRPTKKAIEGRIHHAAIALASAMTDRKNMMKAPAELEEAKAFRKAIVAGAQAEMSPDDLTRVLAGAMGGNHDRATQLLATIR